jgi:ribosomal protein S18 acetylase RimI-like enzyme
MKEEVTVRRARGGDAEAIVRLVREHAREDGESSPLTPEFVRHCLDVPYHRILVAEGGGEVIGLLSYSLRDDLHHAGQVCLIEELVVAAPHRGRGVGGALISSLTDELRKSGCAELSVTVMPGNHGGIRFYRAHGLTEEALLLEMHFGGATAEGAGET